VESVSSPIANIGISNRAFEETVEKEFRQMYCLDPDHVPSSIIGEECLEIEDIKNGYKELKVSDSESSMTSNLLLSPGSLTNGCIFKHHNSTLKYRHLIL
jgi:lipoate-protein ligase A